MNVTVDPATFIIYIAKSELTLVQSTPTEIYELPLNDFRLALKDWEDDGVNGGITFLKTHKHNTEVSLGGLTYARVIEILAPYSITFEDGQYAVNLTGANSNVGDKVNVNQVSVRSANSAGLISSPAIEFASFNGGVILDVINGVSGTAFPRGTEQLKSGNIDDALLIANYRGFAKLYIHSDINLDNNADLNEFLIQGQSHVNTEIYIESNAQVTNVIFNECTLSGILDGGNEIKNCIIKDIDYVNGHMHNCSLNGTIILAGNKDAYIANCSMLDISTEPVIDMGYAGQNLIIVNYTGNIHIKNLNGTNSIGIGLNAGIVILHSDSVTNGTIIVSGIGQLVDELGNPILSGNWNGVEIKNALISKETIAEAIWDEPIADHLLPGTTGIAQGIAQFNDAIYIDTVNGISGTDFPIGTKRIPVNNVEDAITIGVIRGINNLQFYSDYTFDNTVNIANYNLIGQGLQKTTLTFEGGCILAYCKIYNATVTGNETGIIGFTDCLVDNIGSVGLAPSSVTVIAKNCIFKGTTTLPSNYSGSLNALDCWSAPDASDNPPLFDIGGSTAEVQAKNWSGLIKFKNITNPNNVHIFLTSGGIILDSTVTDGSFLFAGVGTLEDNSTSVTELITDGLMSKETVSEAVWDEPLSNHVALETTGEALLSLSYDNTVYIDTVNGFSGSTYPIGMRDKPVNNFADALLLIPKYNLNNVHIIGSLTVSGGEDITGLTFKADRSTGNTLTITASVNNGVVYVQDLTCLNIVQTGSYRYTTSVLVNITNFDGGAKDCLIIDTSINITGTGSNYFTNCDRYVTDETDFTIIDVGDKKLNLIRCRGNFAIANKTSTDTMAIDLTAGLMRIDNSCVAGTIAINGITEIIDNSDPGCTVLIKAISNPSISDTVWEEPIADHLTTGSTGHALSTASSGGVDIQLLVDGVWNEAAADHIAAGSFGAFAGSNTNILKTILGLVQHNFKFFNQTYNANGDLETGNIRIFENSTDCDANVNPTGEYEINATYGSDGLLTDYKVIEKP